MSFLKIDRDRLKNRGSVFIAEVGGHGIVIGRIGGGSRVAAMLAVAADHISKGHLPEIRLLKFKKSSNTVLAEAQLHSLLSDYKGQGDYYLVTSDVLDKMWREV